MSTKIITFNPHNYSMIYKTIFAVNKRYCQTIGQFIHKVENVIGLEDMSDYSEVEVRYYDIPVWYLFKLTIYINQKQSPITHVPSMVTNMYNEFNLITAEQQQVGLKYGVTLFNNDSANNIKKEGGITHLFDKF
jgi:hypothetical protein